MTKRDKAIAALLNGPAARLALVERNFWAKAEWRGKCLVWTASLLTNGGGAFGLGGIVVQASRLAWALVHGKVPTKLICHNCPDGDNRACINPDHLWEGTHSSNTKDMFAKGRSWQQTRPWLAATGDRNGARTHRGNHAGVLNGRAKLTPNDVRKIRRARAKGEPLTSIAARFSVAFSLVDRIAKRKAWKHIK